MTPGRRTGTPEITLQKRELVGWIRKSGLRRPLLDTRRRSVPVLQGVPDLLEGLRGACWSAAERPTNHIMRSP